MIVNNLRAMERMRELYESNTALTLPHLLELHHATSHRVHYMTARSDLAQLEELGLLHSRRVKKVKRYYPSETLLKSAAGSARSKRARHNG
jgi:Fe2+ or Zn2+ uptake regulation protein